VHAFALSVCVSASSSAQELQQHLLLLSNCRAFCVCFCLFLRRNVLCVWLHKMLFEC
jgi:hypothetical protein